MTTRIGFDRHIRREWLDALVDQLVQQGDPRQARSFLHTLLAPVHPGSKARANTVTVLMRMWVAVPPEYEPWRRQALEALRGAQRADFLPYHWGMALLGFPLFRNTAVLAGRLLALQGHFQQGQVQRRLAETWGERSTVHRACRRALSSMVDWGVLTRLAPRGRYGARADATAVPPQAEAWLLAAALGASGAEEIEALQLLRAPELFPFRITGGVGELRRTERFAVCRQGQDLDMVALRPTQAD